MPSVTSVVKQTKQPRGGYVKPKSAIVEVFNDGYDIKDNKYDGVDASLIGTVVDYTTRWLISDDFKESFKIPVEGFSRFAMYAQDAKLDLPLDLYGHTILDNMLESLGSGWDKKYGWKNTDKLRERIVVCAKIGYDSEFSSVEIEDGKWVDMPQLEIRELLQLCLFDVFTRNLLWGVQNWQSIQDSFDRLYDLPHDVEKHLCADICIMIKRSLDFFDRYGPITKDGFTFEGGYTDKISSGDGDFLTKDTLWDFKVSKNEPTTQHTLQLLIYYLMGVMSDGAMGRQVFLPLKNLGIFNPRLNKVYIWKLADIFSTPDVIKSVGYDIIGYPR